MNQQIDQIQELIKYKNISCNKQKEIQSQQKVNIIKNTLSSSMDNNFFKILQRLDKRVQLQKMQQFTNNLRNFKQKSHQNNFKTAFRFHKNKNIVQANKQNLQFTRQINTPNQEVQQGSKPLSTQSMSTFKRTVKTQRGAFRSTQRLSFGTKLVKSQLFQPKIKDQIIKRHKQLRTTRSSNIATIESLASNRTGTVKLNSPGTEKLNPPGTDKLGLQKLLTKNRIHGQRCLMGLNIPLIQQTSTFSRFQLFNLYTYYKTLLKYSHTSIPQFKKGFQSILHINKIQLNSQMIDRCFQSFFKDISFQHFIKIYGNIQNLLFTQNIIQYVKAVFTDYYREEYLSVEKVLEVLKKKMEQAQAQEICKMLYDYLNRKDNQDIQLNEMLKACHENINICRKFFNAMTKSAAGLGNLSKS